MVYRDGLQLGNKPAKSFKHPTAVAIIRDVLEGYFPGVLKKEFPRGCVLELIDLSNVRAAAAAAAAVAASPAASAVAADNAIAGGADNATAEVAVTAAVEEAREGGTAAGADATAEAALTAATEEARAEGPTAAAEAAQEGGTPAAGGPAALLAAANQRAEAASDGGAAGGGGGIEGLARTAERALAEQEAKFPVALAAALATAEAEEEAGEVSRAGPGSGSSLGEAKVETPRDSRHDSESGSTSSRRDTSSSCTPCNDDADGSDNLRNVATSQRALSRDWHAQEEVRLPRDQHCNQRYLTGSNASYLQRSTGRGIARQYQIGRGIEGEGGDFGYALIMSEGLVISFSIDAKVSETDTELILLTDSCFLSTQRCASALFISIPNRP